MGIASSIKPNVKRWCKTYYLNRTARHLSLPVAELFFQHNGMHDFQRYDMLVQLLAVENYFGKNDFGLDFYMRMQVALKGSVSAERSIEEFCQLIKNYEEHGYDTCSEILLDRNLRLIDGSHRMAIAMYYKQSEISVKVIKDWNSDLPFGIEWFLISGFTQEECNVLRKKYLELHDYYMQPFVCILWHPAAKFYDEITEKLRLFGKIGEVKDYLLSATDYEFYMRGIYRIDEKNRWKINKKIEYIIDGKNDRYSIRAVELYLENPIFSINRANRLFPKQCVFIKRWIRQYYKDSVDNYFSDIVIHISDDFCQNKHNADLFKLFKEKA